MGELWSSFAICIDALLKGCNHPKFLSEYLPYTRNSPLTIHFEAHNSSNSSLDGKYGDTTRSVLRMLLNHSLGWKSLTFSMTPGVYSLCHSEYFFKAGDVHPDQGSTPPLPPVLGRLDLRTPGNLEATSIGLPFAHFAPRIRELPIPFLGKTSPGLGIPLQSLISLTLQFWPWENDQELIRLLNDCINLRKLIFQNYEGPFGVDG
ncbi:hypothetical protein D9758_010706 [Tetrapyrgos nigripes]|uniref:Uncharacterized protein n=1 Tax=Tetrapyrgos nigripes TaxID=182062 RepID=A0A8H5GGN7_9AGAR|nr:hypothetical protein D9758_010706 [Tetrapyrgos nigripes]